MTNIYIKYTYTTPTANPDPPDYIGPFDNANLATLHKEIFIPRGEIVLLDEEVEDAWSPDEHLQYITNRA